MTRLIRVLAVSALAFAAVVTPAAAAAPSTTVRPDPTYQQQPFQGWGTSLIWFANATGGYPAEIRDRLAELLFGEQGLRLNMARYNIGGGNAPDVPPYLRPGAAVPGWWRAPAGTTREDTDWWRPGDPRLFDASADPRQRWWVDRIKSKVTHWEAFSNSPPWFQTVSGYVSGGFDPSADQLRADRVEDFAAYLTQAMVELERAHGIRFDTLDPFNEPNTPYWRTTLGPGGDPTGGRQEGAHLSPGLQAKVIPPVAAALRAKSLRAAVSAPDETNPGIFAENWAGYPAEVRAKVGQLNVHTYGTGRRTSARDIAKGADKPLWMSEVDGSWGSGQSFTSMDPGLGIAERVIDDLRELEPRSWQLWQAIEDYDNMKPGGESPAGMNWGVVQIPFNCGPKDTLATCAPRVNTKFHTLRNFTHHIRPGDRLVAVDTTTDVAAVRGPGAELTSVVHLNKTDQPRTVHLDLSRFASVSPYASVRPVVTDARGALAEGAAVRVRDGKATLTVPARSVTTFQVRGVSGVRGEAALGGAHRLTGAQSGKSLAPAGSDLVQRTTDPAAADQVWRLERKSGGYGNRAQFAVVNAATGQRLAAAGSAVVLRPGAADSPEARWIPSSTGDGSWTFVNAGTGAVLDVTGESQADGARIGLYQPTSRDNQRWAATRVS
ncbi:MULTISPECIES: RICIN domain-containing protein [unclassified Crossiella]|uniref:RICIN domain-containing protein n=1 Tax=unclassified Crossiella TaxID=2620835 RepID=UPI001FFF2AC0|nr:MULTISPECIES: RICIN domain-containing protein [unclassified Crossiella]MCK2244971.1 RICIN domain-containing protein [Crossiella sp. S99.2]MCK2258696.1 RICIN domain-containing protein [Crossiella sp. S99.1]